MAQQQKLIQGRVEQVRVPLLMSPMLLPVLWCAPSTASSAIAACIASSAAATAVVAALRTLCRSLLCTLCRILLCTLCRIKVSR